MNTLATELSFAESTISRAISNKYIESKKGVFALKSFFTNAVSTKELSSSEIKNFINQQIEYENKEEPLTDDDLLIKIEQRFNIKMVRRTITKYRKLMNVPSSKERKKDSGVLLKSEAMRMSLLLLSLPPWFLMETLCKPKASLMSLILPS